MRRRDFIVLFGGVTSVWSLPAQAQQATKMPRIGVLWHVANAEEEDVYLSVMTKAFADLGYVDGKTIQLEHRFPAEQPDRFRAFAREFVESKVDAIIAATSLGAKEAKQATNTIPVVFVHRFRPRGQRGLSKVWPAPVATSRAFRLWQSTRLARLRTAYRRKQSV